MRECIDHLIKEFETESQPNGKHAFDPVPDPEVVGQDYQRPAPATVSIASPPPQPDHVQRQPDAKTDEELKLDAIRAKVHRSFDEPADEEGVDYEVAA